MSEIHNQREIELLEAQLRECRAENAKLLAALEEIISFQVFGFAITAPEGGDVWCEGTNRFIREEAMVKVRKIARTALGGDND